FDGRDAVALVEDRERAAERLLLAAEHHQTEGVERRDDDALGTTLPAEALLLHDVLDALGHFAGGLVREGERTDHVRGSAALHQPRDAVGDDARLARARASEH